MARFGNYIEKNWLVTDVCLAIVRTLGCYKCVVWGWDFLRFLVRNCSYENVTLPGADFTASKLLPDKLASLKTLLGFLSPLGI